MAEHAATLVRSRWRLYAWAVAVMAVVLGVSLVGPSPLVLAALPLLDAAFRGFHRAQDHP